MADLLLPYPWRWVVVVAAVPVGMVLGGAVGGLAGAVLLAVGGAAYWAVLRVAFEGWRAAAENERQLKGAE